MEFIDENYQPPETTYNTFPDGKCKVHAFQWFSVDNNQNPILIMQKNGDLVGRLRFILTDGSEGPPMSLKLGEMALLARAFGTTVSDTPPANQGGMVSKFMLELQEKCKKELEVEVSKGWVNTVPGMDVPAGYSYFHVKDVTGDNTGGQLKARRGEWGDFFFVTFEIDAGEGGSDTPYKGAQFTELVNLSLEMRDGQLDWERTKPKDGSLGVYTASGFRLSRLVKLTTPNINLNQLSLESFLPAWRRLAIEEAVTLKGSRMKEEKGSRIRLVWSTIETATGYRRIIEEMDVDNKVRRELVEILDKLADSKSTVGNTYTLTEAGKQVAKAHLSPLKKEGLIKHGSLDELTPEEVTIIVRSLVEKGLIGEDVLGRVIALGVGIDQPVMEEEDSPF